jgi:hypothetical protein
VRGQLKEGDRRGSQPVVGERRDNESRESPVNSRAPTEIVDGQEIRRKRRMVNTVSERTVCNTDGCSRQIKECERLSGVVCNPTSTANMVQYFLKEINAFFSLRSLH